MADADASASRNTLAELIARGERRKYRRGTIFIHEGDAGGTFFIILTGRVKVYSVDDRDREITYNVFGPGDTIGEMSLDGGPRSASVMALEPTTCAAITHEVLRSHIKLHPEFAFELISQIIARARLATRTARNMALLDVYGRLIAVLDSMAARRGEGGRVIVGRPTHLELAGRVGCSREMITRLLKDLRAGGYLVQSGKDWLLPRESFPPRW